MKRKLPSSEKRESLPILQWWWVIIAATATIGMTVLAIWWLFNQISKESNLGVAAAKLDAIRTSLSVGIGAGGALALWLAVRRQRSTELQLSENARIAAENKAHQERVVHATEEDLRERRITDLYTKAVEQLGSSKAPVRLGGLYALERLAQNHSSHRQTIVNIFCAYLRMPYTPPSGFSSIVYPRQETPGSQADKDLPLEEELHVRITAQRILINHLQPNSGDQFFWPNIDLDLTAATLIDFRLEQCQVDRADFQRSKFISTARFDQTTFRGEVWFFHCEFDLANFYETIFLDRAIFTGCHFEHPNFAHARFADEAFFGAARFHGLANFSSTIFEGETSFEDYELTESESYTTEGDWPSSGFRFDDSRIDPTAAEQSDHWPDGWRVESVSTEYATLVQAAALSTTNGNESHTTSQSEPEGPQSD
jgi:hypothetical protein